jgi:hypothetical protein
MNLKDLQEGMLVAYCANYSSVRRARINRIEKHGRAVGAIYISHGRSFEHSDCISAWKASACIIDTWENHRQAQEENKEMRQRAADLRKRIVDATSELMLSCQTTENSVTLRGTPEHLEMLAIILEDAAQTKSSQGGALDTIFGSSKD